MNLPCEICAWRLVVRKDLGFHYLELTRDVAGGMIQVTNVVLEMVVMVERD